MPRKNYLDPRDPRQVWPHNGRPSARHQFKVTFQNGSEFGEKCQRCGCHYNTRVGGSVLDVDADSPVVVRWNLTVGE